MLMVIVTLVGWGFCYYDQCLRPVPTTSGTRDEVDQQAESRPPDAQTRPALPMATATALYLSDPYLEQTQLFFLIPWPVDVSSKLAERGLDFLKYQQLEDGNTRYNNMTHCRTTNQATPLAQHHLKPRIYQLHDQF